MKLPIVIPHTYNTLGYTPSWYDKLTGKDFGVSRCLRNGTEAFLCYQDIIYSFEKHKGWSPQLVSVLITNAQSLPKNTANAFWQGLNKQIFQWLKDNGYKPKFIPDFDKAMEIFQENTEGAFNWNELEKKQSRFFQDLAKETSKDFFKQTKDAWKELPRGIKIAIISGGSLFLLVQIATIANTVGRLIPAKK